MDAILVAIHQYQLSTFFFVINHMPVNAVADASVLQKAIYFDGIEPENWEAYGKYAAQFGIEPRLFAKRLQMPLHFPADRI